MPDERYVLVFGATGTVGSQVVRALTDTRARVRAATRTPAAAVVPPGVEVVQADLTRPDTLDRCLDGVDTIFLVWTAPRSAVDAALERILERTAKMVFLSAPIKTPHPFFQQPNPSRDLALHIEQLIERAGREWTIVRPGMFAANARDFWGPQIRAGDTVRWPYLDAPTAPIDERDIAAVAVRALTETGHAGREYVITGPQSLTQYEQIATIGRVLDRPLRIEELSREDAQREWSRTLPPAVVKMLLDAWAAAVGQPAYVTTVVQEVTGAAARPFLRWVEDNASAFQPRDRAASTGGVC